MKFNDYFLQRKISEEPNKLNIIRQKWNMTEDEFVSKVENWFHNFKEYEKELALKVLGEINYYSEKRFNEKMTNIGKTIDREIIQLRKKPENKIIIVPDKRGDSADKHSYDIAKSWAIPQSHIIPVSELTSANITNENILIAFNDTHGTGKQFVFEMLKPLKAKLKNQLLFVVGITIAEKALNYFKYELKNIRVIPDSPAYSIFDSFTFKDYFQLEELCSKVYPSHPLGFGNTGLLTAYYFQCPNNTLPIIWADGKNNSSEGNAYPWTPLFAYKPKIKERKQEKNNESGAKFIQGNKIKFSSSEIEQINDILISWRCSTNILHNIVKKLPGWFDNFEPKDKDLALKLFSQINYMSLARTRKEIRSLRDNVMSNIMMMDEKDNKSDIVLVLTGYEKESLYHYVFDFLKIWDLKTAQAIALEDLIDRPYEALNKHLVYFYHTRVHKEEYFVSEIWDKAKELPAKSNHVLSYIMSEKIKSKLDDVKSKEKKAFIYYYSEKLSKLVHEVMTPEEFIRLEALYKSKNVRSTNLRNKFLTSYYFDCPKDTLSLLWYDKKWNALFKAK